jgi:hypothetical protein
MSLPYVPTPRRGRLRHARQLCRHRLWPAQWHELGEADKATHLLRAVRHEQRYGLPDPRHQEEGHFQVILLKEHPVQTMASRFIASSPPSSGTTSGCCIGPAKATAAPEGGGTYS